MEARGYCGLHDESHPRLFFFYALWNLQRYLNEFVSTGTDDHDYSGDDDDDDHEKAPG
eukprot:CAMPEP_0197240138 /NCGR_PEP_ID=MMETSP1429-20130617/6482_1 /TAXON_ID=49237 /ORGANISM="Chaetoceros  sp., Strain UNC1202" /LENGTH=57 /DNA_ID=CAMNT_0042699715 /DNA_START=611 /DNA_END=784 /DNA_ORIENTATION=-